MNRWQRFASAAILAWAVIVGGAGSVAAQTKPEGEMRFALYVTVAPAWLDPAEAGPGFVTPFWIMYGLHDALVKPMPGNRMAPSLAESWTESADRLVYEFTLRKGLKFHNGDPFTAEDVVFSFQRAKGAQLKEKVKEVVARRSLQGAVRAARAVAGLHDLLRHAGERRRLDHPEELLRKGRRRRLPQAPDRPWPLQVRQHEPGHRTGDGGERELLAQGAVGQTPRLQERPGRDHPPCDAETGRGGCRLSAGRTSSANRSGTTRS